MKEMPAAAYLVIISTACFIAITAGLGVIVTSQGLHLAMNVNM